MHILFLDLDLELFIAVHLKYRKCEGCLRLGVI